MDRSERFHKIDQLLKDRQIVSMKAFLDELEVSHATIKRDLEYMRDRLQAPIEWDVKRHGYHYTEQSQFSLPGLWLNAAEIQISNSHWWLSGRRETGAQSIGEIGLPLGESVQPSRLAHRFNVGTLRIHRGSSAVD